MQSALDFINLLDKSKDSNYIHAIFVELSNRLVSQSCTLSIQFLNALLTLSSVLSLHSYEEGDWLHSPILPILWQHSNDITIDNYKSDNENNKINKLLLILLFKIYSELSIDDSMMDLIERLVNRPTIAIIILLYNLFYKIKMESPYFNEKFEIYREQTIRSLLPLTLLSEFREITIFCFCSFVDMGNRETLLPVYVNFYKLIKEQRLNENSRNLNISIPEFIKE
jgi:hypothetical protein